MWPHQFLISKKFLIHVMDDTSLKIVSVSEKGQITIPREIQVRLGIKKGDKLVLITKNKKLLIQKPASVEQFIEDDLDITTHSENSLERLWDNKSDDIWSQYLK